MSSVSPNASTRTSTPALLRVVGAVAAVALALAACGNGKSSDSSARRTSTTRSPIGIDDAPGDAGPPVPTTAGVTTTAAPGRVIEAPFPAPTRKVSALIRRAGLPALPNERLEYHVHSHLDVFVDGQAQKVPPDLGIDRAEGVLSPLHTHDDSGIIHVENDKPATFTLGQLFIEWDVRLDAACIGSYCRATKPVAFYVDGEKFTGAPESIELARHREVSIVIGAAPKTIPKAYDWPENV
ncbi:MAG: hypothetical protein H0W70_00875 [Actinobacteria bacterium]|nr:hypothetical protein [Actinomycetota bacterium]